MKFLVLKNEDIEKYTGNLFKAALSKAINSIRQGRSLEDKSTDNTYLVINVDEPYAGIVADLIESEEKRKGTWDHGEKSMREVIGIEEDVHDIFKELMKLREENLNLKFTADTYTYLSEVLKEMPDILPQVLAKVNNEDFKARFIK